MAKGASTGFASTVNQVTAAQAKKARKVAAIPATPEIKATVQEFRAKVKAAQAEVEQRHHIISIGDMVTARGYTSAGKTCYQFAGIGIVKAVVTENRRSFRDGKVHEHKRVTVMVDSKRYDVLATMIAPAYAVEPAKLSPLPERVVVLDVEPLLLPSVTATTFARRQRKVQQLTRQFAKLPTVQLASGDVIQLPAYFGSGGGDYLAEARAKYQAKMDAGENVSGGVEHQPSYQGTYSGSMHSWSRR